MNDQQKNKLKRRYEVERQREKKYAEQAAELNVPKYIYKNLKTKRKKRQKHCVSYEEAKKIVAKYEILDKHEYERAFKEQRLPTEILPASPHTYYKEFSFSDFFDLARQKRAEKDPVYRHHYYFRKNGGKYLSYEEAKRYVQTRLPLYARRTLKAYKQYVLDNCLYFLPANPAQIYRKDGFSTKDFFGDYKFLPYADLKALARKIGIRSYDHWIQYWKVNKRPSYIPADPSAIYKDQWEGWPEFLGNKGIENKHNLGDELFVLFVYNEQYDGMPENVVTLKKKRYMIRSLLEELEHSEYKIFALYEIDKESNVDKAVKILKTLGTPWENLTTHYIVPNIYQLLWEYDNLFQRVDISHYLMLASQSGNTDLSGNEKELFED